MSFEYTQSESNQTRRTVPLWCVGSNGTTPAAAEAGGQPTWLLNGLYRGATTNTLSAWSANAGEYYVLLTQSELSVAGHGVVRYNSAGALESSTAIRIAPVDSFDSTRAGLVALPNQPAEAAGGLITFGIGVGQMHTSSGSIGLKAQTHSLATIGGVAGRIDSSVTIADGNYSAVTVRPALLAYSGLTVQVSNIAPAVYSGVTVGISGIAAGTYSGVSVEVSNINRASMQSQADRILNRSIAGNADGGGRIVQDAFRVLRNKVAIGGSTGTVYTEDDTTSAFTFSVTTSANASPIISIDPAGP